MSSEDKVGNYKPFNCCGIIHSWSAVFSPDLTGCILPEDHKGPHEFISEGNKVYQWETDWDCTCEDCMSGEGDLCTVYWEKKSPKK